MKWLAPLLLTLALFCGGCPPPSDKPQPVEMTLTAPEAKRVQRIREFKKPAHVDKIDELITKCEVEESRESAWSRNLTILGAGLGVLVLAAVALKIWWPLLGKLVKLRWMIEAAGVGAVCALGAIFIDQVFTFVLWLKIAIAVLLAGGLVWEAACLYYTHKLDIPGDGVKPSAK